jgi:hypothetical protein
MDAMEAVAAQPSADRIGRSMPSIGRVREPPSPPGSAPDGIYERHGFLLEWCWFLGPSEVGLIAETLKIGLQGWAELIVAGHLSVAVSGLASPCVAHADVLPEGFETIHAAVG